MKQVYVKNDVKKVSLIVTDEVANALIQTRRAIWRGDSYERYYRETSLDAMTDKDERIQSTDLNPETICIAAEEQAELKAKLFAALK